MTMNSSLIIDLLFEKSGDNILFKYLNLLTYKDNIEDVYHYFTTTLSNYINKFSIEVSCKKNNRTNNTWYDNDCKNARKSIKDVSNEPLKIDKINKYKSLIKKKKRYYINRKQERISHLSKLNPKKFWRQIQIHKTKENNMIPLKDWNS
jgi:hypothetical protein